jgi:hypothetical protein
MSQIQSYLKVGGSGGAIITLEGNSGGKVGPDGTGNINVIGGTNISVVGTPGTSTLTINASAGLMPWTVITVSQAALVNNGYITNGAGTVIVTLPAVSPVGSVVAVTGINNATGWSIGQNAGNTIFFGTGTTTAGVGGSITSTATHDSIFLVCVTANANWQVLNAVGNLTLV